MEVVSVCLNVTSSGCVGTVLVLLIPMKRENNTKGSGKIP